MWTYEQLHQTIGEVAVELDKLYNLERPLTEEEKKLRSRMQMRKYVLEKIKEAKEKNLVNDELYNSTIYGLLVPWGEKHPILMFLVSRWIKARWWGIGGYGYRQPPRREEKEVE
jgi:hypothetical protein